jgi:uncharacterized protein YcbK (DUF882 family)
MATTKASTRLRLSPHFCIEEFDCHDGTHVPKAAIPALKELCTLMLEPLRAKYGSCTVNCGYRTASWNARTPGSATHSQHIYDQHPNSVAADVTFSSGGVPQWAASARWRVTTKPEWTKGGRGGVGDYPSACFIHVDNGPRRDWHG